ncbi:hypothetical protein EBZ02_09065, partial [bacterium]|nr:hypothetical protein [bacterium]
TLRAEDGSWEMEDGWFPICDLRSSIFRSAAISIACCKTFSSKITSLAAIRLLHSPIPMQTNTANTNIPHVVIDSRRPEGSPRADVFKLHALRMLRNKHHTRPNS